MASSDDEEEVGVECVWNYYFVDDEDVPVTFSLLPVQWSENDSVNENNNYRVFLHGSVDKGLRMIHKEVIAWKFDLLKTIPDISVLTKEKMAWIKLEKPRKSFEEMIRTELITVHCLHYARRSKEASEKSTWDYLSKFFCLYDVQPSYNDLADHRTLISETVKKDALLANSKFLLEFLEENPRKRKLLDENVQITTLSSFIVDDVDDDILEDLEEDNSNFNKKFDVCTFCDDGGELICCDGSCMRSFHATAEDGIESMCVSLGFTRREVQAIPKFICKNCEYKQHQCFACGQLGSSDKSSGAEVFRCANATCCYFYHPHCISKLLCQEDEVAARDLQKMIFAGEESFTCPIHKCRVCKQGENKKIKDLQFAVCRRCPTSYHRKCLPSEIAFEKKTGGGGDVEVRAWEGLLLNRVLIFCLEHEIIEHLGTPVRDIRFPDAEEKKKKQILDSPQTPGKFLPKKIRITSGGSFSGDDLKKVKELSSGSRKVTNVEKIKRISSGSTLSRKVEQNAASGKSIKGSISSSLANMDRSTTANARKSSLGDRLFDLMCRSFQQVPQGKQDMHSNELDKTIKINTSSKKLSGEQPSLDVDAKRSNVGYPYHLQYLCRVLALMKESSYSISMEEIRGNHVTPSTHSYSLKSVVEKTITAGMVDGAVEAVRTALKKLEDGCNTEDAEAVCEPDILNQISRWKSTLKVYLAPFLNGMRYTSFGRHFTKVEKLQEIVNMLHWYVEDGDMIVDFCCGANDFSYLMKKKLQQTGKKCSYKNYDVIPPKNDFNFEKKDWMTVSPKELRRNGSQLIMGLNPPFGVKASLANKFINKALEFKPKLLILIVPPETHRLDKKNPPYYLVWEDDQFMSGKSFYLPGSIGKNDKQLDQWNLIAPPLYLWSRPDWHEKHLAIARRQGHLSRCQGGSLKRSGHENVYNDQSQEVRIRASDKSTESRQTGGKPPRTDTYERIPRHSPPINSRFLREDPTAKSFERLPHAEVAENGYLNSESGMYSSYLPFETSYAGSMTRNLDNVGRKYGMNIDEYSDKVHGFSHPSVGEQSVMRMRRDIDAIGHRPYVTDARELDLRSEVRRYEQDPDSSARRNHTGGHNPGYGQMGSLTSMPYKHLGTAAESSYMMYTPAMQGYAPRLDNLNHTMMGNVDLEQSMMNRSDMYYPRPSESNNP